jgi:hypothetical protein
MHLLDVEAAIERLVLLEYDHPLAGSLHAEVENLGQRYLEAGSLESEWGRSVPKSNCQSYFHIQAAHQHRGRLGISSGRAIVVLR